MSTLLHDYYLPDKNMPMPCKIKNFMGNYRGNFGLRRSEVSSLVYRNREGNLVDVPTVTASELKNTFGTVFEQTIAGGVVAITKHARPKAVLFSFAEFEALTKVRTSSLDDLSKQFDDAMLARMQKPKAKKAMTAAFNATPAKLAGAAVRAAAKRR
jgi:prevent-host-death family protein